MTVPTQERRRPGAAVTGPASAFGALLAAAAREPSAARGLALAYAALPPGHRKQLVDAVVVDAQQEGMCASLVLASLLSVEENAAVAQHIADAMAALETREMSIAARVKAMLSGDETAGGIVIIRPLHGTFVEALGLVWEQSQGITLALYEPLAHYADAKDLVRELPGELQFEEMPLMFAIDMAAPALWNHRRMHGALPTEMERFADLFSCSDRL